MTTAQKTIRRITSDELDEVLAHAIDEKWTDLALLGPRITIHDDEKYWPQSLKKHTHIYQPSELISDLGIRLSKLTSLTSLLLWGNRLGDAGVKHLSNLVNLTSLDLSANQIGDTGVKHLSSLVNLTSLDLSRNQIGDIVVKHLSNLVNLTSLDLSRNQIGDTGVMHLSSLVNLTSLVLSGNPLANQDANNLQDTNSLRHLVTLTNLERLFVRQTDITSIAPLSDLSNLRSVDIRDTSVSDLSPLRKLLESGIVAKREYSEWSDGIYVEYCPLIHPPPEIVQQGHEAVLNYFREIDAQGTATLLEAKVLIVGEGRAGKTSLLRRLYQPDQPLPSEDATTRGIDICPYHFQLGDGRTFRLNVWDFGGQQIYHATHQFFLTKNSLYILLDDTAKDAQSVTDENFRYWLEVIDLLSKHSPVLIFQNEKGGRSKAIDIQGIKGRFDNVKEVYNGNLMMPRSTAKLAQAIEYQVQQLPHVGEQVPAKWVDIRRALEQKAVDKAYISQQDYFDLYEQYLEFNREKALRLSQYLHDLGVFLHFQDDKVLRKSVILQNRWATEAVFRVFDDETVKSQLGRFTIADCERIWSQSEYRDMHDELRALMEKFELCYALPDLPKNEETWLMPQLLPPSTPAELSDWKRPGDLVLTYRYHFLPKGLINRLMVRKHRYAKRPHLAWSNGVLFEADDSSVLVQATSRGDEIVLRARGLEAKNLLGIIAADLDALNASFSGLEDKLQKLIPCNCNQCVATSIPEMYEYKYLLKRKQDVKLNIECRASYLEVNVMSLLDGFIPASIPLEKENRGETKTIKIFLASSEEMRDDRDEFDRYFRQQNDRLRKKDIYLEIIRWENFLDAMSKTRLQDEYNQAVRDCDIFVSLFMTKTGTFTEEEFNVAHQAFQQNDKPRIFTYFKDASTSLVNIDKAAMQSLWKFQEKLKKLGHYWTSYNDIEGLKRHFRDQLDKILDKFYDD
ncbi:MAG: leucine-rich repeat domain-containing protein [Nitrosomonas sp.]|nr:leucine-rich repeat domain-containing protein [Nitrosomonas sp.]